MITPVKEGKKKVPIIKKTTAKIRNIYKLYVILK